MMSTFIRRTAGTGAVLLALGQFVRPQLTNPPVTEEVPATPEVRALLRRACNDCHSNETVWPWYAKLAPVSWLVAHDVAEARDELNFSTWDVYRPGQRNRKLKEVLKTRAEGEMPPAQYVLMHPEARLTDAQISLLRTWAENSQHYGN